MNNDGCYSQDIGSKGQKTRRTGKFFSHLFMKESYNNCFAVTIVLPYSYCILFKTWSCNPMRVAIQLQTIRPWKHAENIGCECGESFPSL